MGLVVVRLCWPAVVIGVMDVWEIRVCTDASARLVEDIKPSVALSNIKVVDIRRASDSYTSKTSV